MNYTFFVVSAYIVGVFAAVPAGPVQIEVIRRSVSGHIRSALMVIIGAIIADVAYGIVAFYGMATFLRQNRMMAYFWMAGSVVLSVLGLIIIRNSLKSHSAMKDSRYLRKKRWGFVGGLSLSVTNPAMIIWWLVGAKLFFDLRLIDKFSSDIAISFIAAGASGIASYLVVLSLFVYWAKRFISDGAIRRINIAAGLLMIIVACYFFASSVIRM